MANISRIDPQQQRLSFFDPFRDLEDFFGSRRLRSLFRDMPEELTLRQELGDARRHCEVRQRRRDHEPAERYALEAFDDFIENGCRTATLVEGEVSKGLSSGSRPQ